MAGADENHEIQVQFEFRGVKRVFVTREPRSYSELISLIQVHVEGVNSARCCIMYENDEGDYVVLSKDAHSLAIAIQSSKVIPGVNLTRFKVKVLECTSPSIEKDTAVDHLAHSLSTGMKELSPGVRSPDGKRCRFDAPKCSAAVENTCKSKKKLSFTPRFEQMSNDDDIIDDERDEDATG